MIFEMLRWWYVSGWLLALQRIVTWTKGVESAFSLTILVQTLFLPWRRIITMGGKSLDAKFHAALDNFLSRCIGAVVRLFVIVGALLSISVVGIAGIVMAIIWPVLPVAVIFCIVKAITG
jgi:phosphate starvation-inducible membrane PsiE